MVLAPRIVHLFREGVRALIRKPAYLISSVIVLSISTAVLLSTVALVQALLMRPPSGRNPKQLFVVTSTLPQGRISYPDYVDLRDRLESKASIFAFSKSSVCQVVVGNRLFPVACTAISGNYFSTLGVVSAVGRLIGPTDDVKGTAPVAVVSGHIAKQLNIGIGSSITLNGQGFEIVGILADSFEGIDKTDRPDIWVPIWKATAFLPSYIYQNRAYQWMQVGGRSNEALDFAALSAACNQVAVQLQKENPDKNYGMGLSLHTVKAYRALYENASGVVLLITAVVWMVFAVGFSNFFAMTMLRLVIRSRELALKMILGATRAHIMMWLLVEIAVIAISSALAAMVIGLSILKLATFHPIMSQLITDMGVHLDAMSAVLVGTMMAAGAAFVWLVSARDASEENFSHILKQKSNSPGKHRLFSILLSIQLAIAFVLVSLVIAFSSLVQRTLHQSYVFRTQNLLLAKIDLRAVGHAKQRSDSVAFLSSIIQKVGAVPGVIGCAASNCSPLSPAGWTNLYIDGEAPSFSSDQNLVGMATISPQFFQTYGVRLLRGRELQESDIRTGAHLAVINASAAKRFWPGVDPVTKGFRPWPNSPLYSIIGVVEDIPEDPTQQARSMIYLPFSQTSSTVFALHISVRENSSAIKNSIADALRSVWPYENVPELEEVEHRISTSVAPLLLAARVVTVVTGFAIVITIFGMYSFSGYAAAETARDAAICMAMGDTPLGAVVRHLKRYSLAFVCGLGAGVALLFCAARILQHYSVPVGSLSILDAILAALVLSAISIIGLCAPLRLLFRDDIFMLLRNESD